MHSGERKDFTLAAITVPHMTRGTYSNIAVGELKGPHSYTEQTAFTTNSFNITHHIIHFTILLYLVVKILGKEIAFLHYCKRDEAGRALLCILPRSDALYRSS